MNSDTPNFPKSPAQALSTSRLWALIPCAGNGSRSGADGPKQYQAVAGQPMVLHTLAAFAAVTRLAGTLVVVSAGDTFFDSLGATFLVAACGGPTRAASVFNGLNALKDQGAALTDWVLVHDAARCLITSDQINTLIDACVNDPVGGLLALKLPDTLKREVGGRVAQTVDRGDKWLAQTPQMFRLGALMDALQAAGDAVTDESSALEFLGLAPLLVEGSAQNFKVTYPQDFALAQAVLLARDSPEKRCTSAIEAAQKTLQSYAPQTPREQDDLRQLQERQQHLIDDGRREGLSECEIWSRVMGLAFNQ